MIAAACCLAAVAYAAPGPASPGPGGRGESPGPPRPRIVKHPMNPSLSASAAFAYTSRLAGAAFACRLDSGPWRHCGGRVAYRGLRPGRHVFSVRVESPAGVRGRSARFEWVRAEPKRFAIEPKGDLGELFPGAPPVPLPLVLRNPNPAPILVTSLRVAVTASPPGCDSGANLLTVPSSASPRTPLRIPAGGAVEVPTPKVSAPALAMRDLPVNQDPCRGARFPLAFSGEAHG